MKKQLLLLAFLAFFSFGCVYIVVPADLMTTPTSTASKGWTGVATKIETTGTGDLHIDVTIRNDTQDWSAMQAVQNKAVLTTSDGKKSPCKTVFIGTGGHRVAPGFQIRGYTGGTKKEPVTQLLYVECPGVSESAGAVLSIDYTYVTGPYDLHIPSVEVADSLNLNLDQVSGDLVYPIAAPAEGPVNKIGDKIGAINNFSLILTDAQRTETGLELHWLAENPSDYPNYVHIGVPPVIGSDGIIYGYFQDPSIADATIALPKDKAEWTTTVAIPRDSTGRYVMVSVETRQSKYFVSHVIDIGDR